MRLSVAMCTYNGERFLDEQLASIAMQTQLPHELVLCDDGSTDGTLRIAEAFQSKAPFEIRIYRNPDNLGYSRNFAQAAALCSGEVIAFSDQDDVWYPQKLARLSQVFEENSAVGGVFSNGGLIDAGSTSVPGTLWHRFRFFAKDQARLNTGDAVGVLLQRNVVTGMAFAFRSSFTDILLSTPESWIHDGWLAFLIAARSKLLALPESLVAYRVHETQQVGTPLAGRAKLRWMQKHGLGAYIQRIHERNFDEYQRTIVLFEDLAEFLRHQNLPGDRALAERVWAKAEFARDGARVLSLERSRRWALVFKNMGAYGGLAPTGLRAAIRDLLI